VYSPPRGGAPSAPQTFSYRLQHSKGYSDAATVTLQVENGLEARTDEFILRQRTIRGHYQLEAPGVLANDTRHLKAKPVLVQNVTVGQVILAADGSFVYVPPAGGGIPRIPLNFTYRLSAGSEYSRVASVNFTLEQALAALPDTLVLSVVDRTGRFILPAPGVLANDTGTGILKAVLIQGVTSGKLVLEPDGGLSYTPPSDGKPSLPLTFRYQVSDGKNLSKEATVTLELRPAPLAQSPAAKRPLCVPVDSQARCELTAARAADPSDGR
jgi:hypothetical protein